MHSARTTYIPYLPTYTQDIKKFYRKHKLSMNDSRWMWPEATEVAGEQRALENFWLSDITDLYKFHILLNYAF